MKARRSICLISLGCPKNLVDSERLVSSLVSHDFQVLAEPQDADVVLINTCGFLDASRQESLGVIRDSVALKEQGVSAVLVAGCMVGTFGEQLRAEAPGVDGYLPFEQYDRVQDLVNQLLPAPEAPSFSVDRRRMDVSLTPAHYAWLKISEGCNHTCAFCVIPEIRGPMRSLPVEELVARARTLAARGVRELILIAQDSTIFGADLYGEVRLTQLLESLDQVDGLEWIRLMYAYPTEVKAPLVDALSSGRRILPYLDVPVQHASDAVLRRMRRGYGRKELDAMLELLRGRCPELALRTTVIVGFPGETEADFQELLDWVAVWGFDRLGAFKYSREDRSRSAVLEDQIPQEVKQERYEALMELQQGIAFEANQARVGKRERVLVDHASEPGKPARARSLRDAPEIDGQVLLADTQVSCGELLEVEITAARGYDLEARKIDTQTGSRTAMEV